MLLGAASDPRNQITDINKLVSILTAVDFSAVNQSSDNILETLQRLFPNVPKKALIEIEKQTSKTVEARAAELASLKKKAKQDTTSASYFYLKLGLAIAAAVGGYYFGGTIAVKLGNTALTKIYTFIFGSPNPGSLTYGILGPCQKLIDVAGTKYGPIVISATAGPSVYNTAAMAEYLCNKVLWFKSLVVSEKPAVPLLPLSTKTADELADEFQELMTLSEKEKPNTEECPANEMVVLGGQKLEICYAYRGKSEQNTKQATPQIQAITLPEVGLSDVNQQKALLKLEM